MNWYLLALKKYAVFNGRARRKEYWMFQLFFYFFAILTIIVDHILGLTFKGEFFGIVYLVYAFAFFIPVLSVSVRRLHDLGKSGWMFLINFIPIIGGIWFLLLMTIDGQDGKNMYGPDPKTTKKISKRNKSVNLKGKPRR